MAAKKEVKYLALLIIAGIIVMNFKDQIAAAYDYIFDGGFKTFIRLMRPLAKQVEADTGTPYEVILAQAALESGNGKSSLSSAPNYNFFGIKYTGKYGGKVTKATKEYENGQYVTRFLDFETFASPADSFRAHSDLLRRVYPAAYSSTDPYVFARALTAGKKKYATDPKYTEKLHKLIKQIQELQ